MTPQDVDFFQVLALLCTISFMGLVLFIVRYLQGLLEARSQIISLIAELGRSLDPILAELHAGAAQFRAAGTHVHHSAQQFSELGDRLGDIGTNAQKHVRVVWALLAQTARTFLKT